MTLLSPYHPTHLAVLNTLRLPPTQGSFTVDPTELIPETETDLYSLGVTVLEGEDVAGYSVLLAGAQSDKRLPKPDPAGVAIRAAQEKIFGPGGVCSNSRERLKQARHEFEAGNLYFNRKITGAIVGVQPFGGYYMSGTDSKAGGPDYLANFLQLKTVTERW